MESGKIPDKSIKASSQKLKHPAHHGRLGGGTYWCSEEEKRGFIQIDLPKKYKITGARIQLKSKYDIKFIFLRGQIFKEWITFRYEEVKLALSFVKRELYNFVLNILNFNTCKPLHAG